MPWEGLRFKVNYFKELFVCFVSGNKTAQPDYLELRCKGSDKMKFLLVNNYQ
jgi:hypothetical protein